MKRKLARDVFGGRHRTTKHADLESLKSGMTGSSRPTQPRGAGSYHVIGSEKPVPKCNEKPSTATTGINLKSSLIPRSELQSTANSLLGQLRHQLDFEKKQNDSLAKRFDDLKRAQVRV